MIPNLAFDLDGIVANFSQPFIYWAKQRYGLKMIPTNKFHWSTEPAITDKMFTNIIAEFIAGEGKELIPPLRDGAALVDYMYSSALRPITFVTARHPSTAGATFGWIMKHFRNIDFRLSIVRSGTSKYRFLDDFDCFVDDRRKTAIDLASRGMVVFMPMREHNFIGPEMIDHGKFQVSPPQVWRNPAWADLGRDHKHQIILLNDLEEMTTGRFDFMLFREGRNIF